MLTQIINGKILTPTGWLDGGSLILNDSKILEIANSDLPRVGATIVDAKGDYIVPGFVAMNVHGGGGGSFKEGTKEDYDAAIATHLKHGATSIYPTIYTTKVDKIYKSAQICEDFIKEGNTPVKGLHIAGPYFNPQMVKSFNGVRNPDSNEYNQILNDFTCIKRWDISPEIEGACDMAKELKKRGILPAISHTKAEFEEVKLAFENGFTHVAQLYNAMPGFHKRGEYKYEGTVESAFLIDDMSVEVIADGKHLPSTILKLVYKLKGVEKMCLVTCALKYAAYDGKIADNYKFIVEDGLCKFKDQTTLAGSTATSDTLIKVMVKNVGIPLEDAVRMASETPAKVMNIWNRVGSFEEGKDADVVLLNKEYDVTGVWSQGKQISL